MRDAYCRAINEPERVFGMDKKALAIAMIAPALLSAVGAPWYVTDPAFPLAAYIGTILAKRDPKFLEIWSRLIGQSGIYDPMKRVQPRIVVRRSIGA